MREHKPNETKEEIATIGKIPKLESPIGMNTVTNATENVMGSDNRKCQRNLPHTAIGALTRKMKGKKQE